MRSNDDLVVDVDLKLFRYVEYGYFHEGYLFVF